MVKGGHITQPRLTANSLLDSLKAPAEANEGMEPKTAKMANSAAILGEKIL